MNINHDNQLTGVVIGAAIAVHRELGPGVDEAACEQALSLKLTALGISHQCQKPLPLLYKSASLECGYRLDLLVDDRLPIELKCVEKVLPVHLAQALTYLRLGGFSLGLLINFEVPTLKQGIQRLAITPPAPGNSSLAMNLGEFDALSAMLLNAAMDVHHTLGPGLLRSAYEECLCHELTLRKVGFVREARIPLEFEGSVLTHGTSIPLLVAGRIPVYCLSVAELTPLHESRLRFRLRQSGSPHGFILNFNTARLTEGIRRLAL